MNNINIALFAALSVVACTPKATQEIGTIVFDYSGTAPVYQYDRVESISIIPLQTDKNCLIGEMPELRVAGDNLFILHGRFSDLEQIDRFNTQGEHLNQIGRRGRGPGEISSAASDWFLYGDKMIGLRGFFSKNILLYDFAGNFVREIQLNTPMSQGRAPTFIMHLQGSDFLALMPAQTDSSRIVRLPETGAAPISMHKSEKTYSVEVEFLPPFFQTNGKLYYSTIHENAIYKAGQDSLTLTFLTNPGKYAIPQDFYNKANWRAFESLIRDNGVVVIYNFDESKNYYIMQLLVMKEEFEGLIWGIKHKQEKEWFWSKMDTWPIGTREYSAAEITEDNRLLMLLTPYSLKKQLPIMKNLLNPHVADSLKDDDNPVLVEIKLR